VSILGTTEAMARLLAGTLDIGLVALPQPPQPQLVLTPWRKQPIMAVVPQRWQTEQRVPRRITPAWLAQQPLIFNDATTHMYRLCMEWFAAAGHAPRARIELNYDAAIFSLVSAGYGAALLPMQESTDLAAQQGRTVSLPITPKLIRRLGIAHRARSGLDGATLRVLGVLNEFRQG